MKKARLTPRRFCWFVCVAWMAGVVAAAVPAAAGAQDGNRGKADRARRQQPVYGEHPTYKGRPIAPVMSWRGWRWLFRHDRKRWERPEELLDALRIAPDAVVADVGAGAGYFTVRLARRVAGGGKVFAVDIQPEMIRLVREQVRRNKLSNVVLVLSKPDDPMLPPNSVDLALMVDVYHEIQNPDRFMPNLIRALREDGRLVLVEYRAEDPTVPIRPEHKMRLRQVKLEMDAFGLRLAELHEFLPWQHVLVFRKAGQPCGSFPRVYAAEGNEPSPERWRECGFALLGVEELERKVPGNGYELDVVATLREEGDAVVLAVAGSGEGRSGWRLRWEWPNRLTLERGAEGEPLDFSSTLHWILYGKRVLRMRITVRQEGDNLWLALDSMPLGGGPWHVPRAGRVSARTDGAAKVDVVWYRSSAPAANGRSSLPPTGRPAIVLGRGSFPPAEQFCATLPAD